MVAVIRKMLIISLLYSLNKALYYIILWSGLNQLLSHKLLTREISPYPSHVAYRFSVNHMFLLKEHLLYRAFETAKRRGITFLDIK